MAEHVTLVDTDTFSVEQTLNQHFAEWKSKVVPAEYRKRILKGKRPDDALYERIRASDKDCH